MITEDYVSFEVAKLLKKKGFNETCFTYYDYIDSSINRFDKGLRFNNTSYPWGVPYNISKAKKYVVAPTLQMTCKWLREVHKLVITVSIGNENNKGNTDYNNPDRWFYFFDITNTKGVVIDIEYDPFSNEFPTYEEAVEAALKYTLENLI